MQSSSKEIVSRINDAMGKLAANVFHKLSYIDTPTNESDIRAIFKGGHQQLTLDGAAAEKNKLALNDVNAYIAINTARHTKTSMKSLLDRFVAPPYGFVEADVQWLVAKLFKSGDISLYVNNEAVTLLSKTEEELVRFLTRKEYAEKLMTERRIKANEKQKKSVREVMKELFHVTSSSEDDDTMMKSFMGYASNLKDDLEKLELHYGKQAKYPGAEVIRTGKRLVAEVSQMKYPNEFFAGVDAKRDDFLDFAEDYEPVKKFFAGDQLGIFDRAIKLMGIYDDSKTFIVNEEVEKIVADVKAIMKKTSPYGEIFKLPALLDSFISTYGKVLRDMEEPILQAIAEARTRVFDELRDKQCKPQLSDAFIRRFDEIREKAIHCNNVATLQNIKVEADALKVRCLNEINAAENKILAQIAAEEAKKQQEQRAAASTEPTEEPPAPVMPAPRVKRAKTISIKSVNTEQTWQIETPEDVKRYITELEKKLLGTLEENTVIHIEF